MTLLEQRDVDETVRPVDGHRARAARRGCACAAPTPRRAAGSTHAPCGRAGAPERSRSAGATSDRVIASDMPSPTSASATARRSCWRSVSAPTWPWRVGQRAPDGVEADAARHLLHEVDLAFEVGAPRRRWRRDVSRSAPCVELDAERRERVPHVLGVERGTEHGVHAARAQRMRGRHRRGVLVLASGATPRPPPARAAPSRARRCARPRRGRCPVRSARSTRCGASGASSDGRCPWARSTPPRAGSRWSRPTPRPSSRP